MVESVVVGGAHSALREEIREDIWSALQLVVDEVTGGGVIIAPAHGVEVLVGDDDDVDDYDDVVEEDEGGAEGGEEEEEEEEEEEGALSE